MAPLPGQKSAVAVLTERISHLCEKIDNLENNMDQLDTRLNTLPNNSVQVAHLSEKLAALENWHTWRIRVLGSAFVVQTVAMLYEILKVR